jgi:tetraacyldisaccharide 4'-kinase
MVLRLKTRESKTLPGSLVFLVKNYPFTRMNLSSKLEHFIVHKIWHSNSFFLKLFYPLSFLYYILQQVKWFLSAYQKFTIPIISVGNLNVGGVGKTPISIALMEIVKAIGKKAAFIGHGYKAAILKDSSSTKVNLQKDNADLVGDEALLLSQYATTYIAKKRSLAIELAEKDGFELVILDDGFQDNSIVKDLTLLVIDAEYLLGNGLLLPIGPLREKPIPALQRAGLIVIAGICDKEIKKAKSFMISKFEKDCDSLQPKIVSALVKLQNLEELIGQDFFAIIAIANPKKVLKTAKLNNIIIKKTFIFSDHKLFDDQELEVIYKLAREAQCQVITTSKDFVKLPKYYQNLTKIFAIKADFDQDYNLVTSIITNICNNKV